MINCGPIPTRETQPREGLVHSHATAVALAAKYLQPSLSMRRRFAYPVLFAVVAAGFTAYYPYSPGGRQALNMRAADQFIPSLLPLVRADARFANVQLDSYTAQDGSLEVHGRVEDEQACADLRRIVLDSRPPVPIAFLVQVLPPTTEVATTRP